MIIETKQDQKNINYPLKEKNDFNIPKKLGKATPKIK